MSLLPLIFKDMERSLRMMEHQMRTPGDDYYTGVVYPMVLNAGPKCDGKESVLQNRDKFQMKLDVRNFAPEEITIKSVDDNAIVVEAKHESNDENGHVFRHFLRKFTIPEGHDIKGVESNLSSTGMLTITAPNKVKEAQGRSIPITHIDSKAIKN